MNVSTSLKPVRRPAHTLVGRDHMIVVHIRHQVTMSIVVICACFIDTLAVRKTHGKSRFPPAPRRQDNPLVSAVCHIMESISTLQRANMGRLLYLQIVRSRILTQAGKYGFE